ncbi:MAG: hypothetical protein H0W06_06300 [Chloroflexia bacterium]|nr:hypothetical protein [Chloroflexia bacterium]
MQSGDDAPRHESVDHEQPTDAGLMDEKDVPGTGIMGDETVVRPAPGVLQPGIAPGKVGERDAMRQNPTETGQPSARPNR